MERIAIVTGASGGIGEVFVDRINAMPNIDKIWAVGRNPDKLENLCSRFSKAVPLVADLDSNGVDLITEKLKSESPDVRLLVNNAGLAYLGRFEDMECKKVASICNVNCTVPSVLMASSLPYMNKGARILNISSASSFQPNPFLSMYSASKVYLKNLSRAVNFELKPRGITVTAVCPYWVDTGMLPHEKNGKRINYAGITSPEVVVDKALRDSARGKDMSVPSFLAKYLRIYSKYTPSFVVMRQWSAMIRKYL